MNSNRHNRHCVLAAAALSSITGCGVVGDSTGLGKASGESAVFEGPVPRAECSHEPLRETALQGQVPMSDRLNGRTLQGYRCNLELVGRAGGAGAGYQHAWYEDCAYYTTAERPRVGPHGTVVVDVADSSAPAITEYLDTVGMLDPWESLKANGPRALLAGVGNANPTFDIYDLAGDCRAPELRFTGPVGTAGGHTGIFAPDGMTYYGTPNGAGIRAIDIADPANPQLLLEGFPAAAHDLSLSDDGTRAYLANSSSTNGLSIIDTTQVQERRANPQVDIVGEVFWPDGAVAQYTQHMTIGGKPYILFADEGAMGAARIIDIADERNPRVISKLKLEIHMPENRNQATADGAVLGALVAGDKTEPSGLIQYDGHYCTASDGKTNSHIYPVKDAVVAVCAMIWSGIRVFDIRDPYNPREIAYYIPPATVGYQEAEGIVFPNNHLMVSRAGAQPHLRIDRNEIWFTSGAIGFQVARFTRPLAELMGPAP